jgi:L-fuculose-phosphate aldolase
MKKLISARDVEEALRNGGDLKAFPADAIYTPAARDLLTQHHNGDLPAPRPGTFTPTGKKAASGGNKTEQFFNSPEMQVLKVQICDIGHRLWAREYVDANGGNISIRVADNMVLCTPTLVSKGFMKPEDICLVDMEGKQLAGNKSRTSEVLMHLAIMKAQPKAKAVVHCHPPFATAFAVCRIQPPTCMIPEFEIFVGEVPVAPYFTPGTPEMGQQVAALADKHNTILMANHGVVAWGSSPEDAYFKMEVVEAYCRTVMVTAQLGVQPKTFTGPQMKDLLQIKQKMNLPDPRIGLKECELCDNSEWRPGVTCVVPPDQQPAATVETDLEAEKLVQTITDLIVEKVKR